jgi:hypothetical protein
MSDLLILILLGVSCLICGWIVLGCLDMVGVKDVFGSITDLIKIRPVGLAHILTLWPWKPIKVETLL